MQRSRIFLGLVALLCVLSLGLAACTAASAKVVLDANTSPITIKGNLAYRERIALPPDSTARVTIHDISIAERNAPVIAEEEMNLDHRQVPIPFKLTVPADRVSTRHSYSLRATIHAADGHLLWTTDTAHPIDRSKALNELGTVWLVHTDARPPNRASLPYKAHGQEPGWLLISKSGMSLEWNYGETKVQAGLLRPVPFGDVLRYTASTDAHQLQATITHAIGRDTMSGIPYPDQVTVVIDDKHLDGCGGDPDSLLAGTQWVVEKINNVPVFGKSQLTLNFGTDGNMSGDAGCNGYSGQYHLTGEGLSIGFMAITAMPCSLPAIEQQKDGSWKPSKTPAGPNIDLQENRLMSVVSHANGFDITDEGKLVLRTDSGETLKAIAANRQP